MKAIIYALFISLFASMTVLSLPTHLLKQLESEDYDQRASAHSQLEDWVKNAANNEVLELKVISQQTESPEARIRLIDILKKAYIAVPNTRGYIGVTMKPKLGGAIITQMQPGQPAAKAGLKVGDVIVAVNTKKLTSMKGSAAHAMQYLQGYLKKRNEGEKLQLKILRGEELLEKDLKLGNYDKSLTKKKRHVMWN